MECAGGSARTYGQGGLRGGEESKENLPHLKDLQNHSGKNRGEVLFPEKGRLGRGGS